MADQGMFLRWSIAVALSMASAPLHAESDQGDCATMWDSSVPLKLIKIKNLVTDAPTSPGRASHLSAGSGIVVVGERFYVVPDDELFLGEFPLNGATPGVFHRIFSGTLPDDHHERKKQKPDWESLALTEQGLLLVPSGSKESRTRGALVPLTAGGAMDSALPIREIDFTDLFRELRGTFQELNIEGAVYLGNSRLRLAQRGNGSLHENALIDLHFEPGVPPRGQDIVSIVRFKLPSIDAVPLSFTDLSVLSDGRTVAIMAAERTHNVVDDGEIAGSAVALIGLDGKMTQLMKFDRAVKTEGVHAVLSGGMVQLLLVTDPDQEALPSELYQSQFKAGP